MKISTLCTTSLAALLALSFSSAAYASAKDDAVTVSANYSTSASVGELPEEPAAQNSNGLGPQSGVPPLKKNLAPAAAGPEHKSGKPGQDSMRPFSRLAIAIKMGTAGAGFDVATPLARKFNLRGGASFFSFDHTFLTDGTSYNASLRLKTAMAAVDWYPFGNAFRLSPIAQIYNGNSVTADASVPALQSFSLNDVDYYSSVGSPIGGNAIFTIGNQGGSKVAPGFTLGFGNMIPRGKGEHWSVPFEMGFVYIQQPQVLLNLKGISCDTQAHAAASVSATVPGVGCSSVTSDPVTQSNIRQEQDELNSDVSPLRFYPILSVGVSYKF